MFRHFVVEDRTFHREWNGLIAAAGRVECPVWLQLVRGLWRLQRVLDSGTEGRFINPELDGRHDIL